MTNQLPLTGHARGKLPFSPQGWPFIISTAIATVLAQGASEGENDKP
jgi:hypothetical protein